MKVLMYGGSGIISSEIVKLCLKRNYEVTTITRGQHKEGLYSGVKNIIFDIRKSSAESIEVCLDDYYDVIIDFLSYEVSELQKGMQIANNRCSQYIFVSSATVLDTRKNGIYCENDSIGNTGWKYASDKAKCEEYLHKESDLYSFEYTIIRPYVTYGNTRIPLQISPVEYYTLVYRMLNGKPIPLYGRNVRCTITYSGDFAVAVVGLLLNEKSYGEIYNIVGEYITTWEEILQYVAREFGVTPEIIYLPQNVLENKRVTYGIDVMEILADKGRDMVFDNSKIKNVVGEFEGKTELSNVINAIFEYFNSNVKHQIINYAWDARIDALLEHSGLCTNKQKKLLRLYKHESETIKDRIIYSANRNRFIYIVLKNIKACMRSFRKLCKNG